MKRLKKLRPTRIYKERSGGAADFGKSLPDGSYSGQHESMLNKVFLEDPCSRLLDAFKSCVKDTWQYTYLPTGKEVFSATNFARPAWNEVSHTKAFRSFSYPFGYFRPAYSDYMNGQLYSCRHYNWISPGIGYDPPLLRGEASDFTRARAWASMQPRFESDFQALNFMFELKDFKEIGGNFARLLSGKDALGKKVVDWFHTTAAAKNAKLKRDAMKRRKDNEKRNGIYKRLITDLPGITAGEAFSKGADIIAETQLLISYMIIPTIKDLVAFSAALATEYLQALDKFKSDGLAPNTRHYSEVLIDNSAVYLDYSSEPGYYPSCVQFRNDDYLRFHASLQYAYKYNLSDCMIAFSKYWGLTGTADEFWNMLPFSFLLDYVLQVSKALKRVEFDKNLDLNVVNYSESYLALRGNSLGFSPYAPSGVLGYTVDGKYSDHDGTYRPFMGYAGSRYTRRLTQPLLHGLILPQWKTPSLNQWYNIGALAKVLLF